MAIRSGQGYRKDLNLRENPADADVWNNLYDAGIDNDLKVLRNNLRNTSVVGFSSINGGFFEFGIASDFVFTDDDHVGLSHTVSFASTSLSYNTDYYITESDGRYRYKLSPTNTSHSSGASTIVEVNTSPTSVDHPKYGSFTGTLDRRILNFIHNAVVETERPNGTYLGISPTSSASVTGTGAIFNFVQIDAGINISMIDSGSGYKIGDVLIIDSSQLGGGGNNVAITVTNSAGFDIIRKDPVHKGDIINFIQPDKQDDEFYYFNGSHNVPAAFDETQANNETAEYVITKKYKGVEDTVTNKDIKSEGSFMVSDPKPYNLNQTAVNANLNGVFIGETRAFSTDNNPWTENGTAGVSTASVLTLSEEVTIGEIDFKGTGSSGTETIEIDGITVTDVTAAGVSADFTHKMPVIINGETYYLLLKT